MKTYSLYQDQGLLLSAAIIPMALWVLFASMQFCDAIDAVLLCATIPRHIRFVAKDTLFRIPILSLLLNGAGAIPVKRRSVCGGSLSIF